MKLHIDINHMPKPDGSAHPFTTEMATTLRALADDIEAGTFDGDRVFRSNCHCGSIVGGAALIEDE